MANTEPTTGLGSEVLRLNLMDKEGVPRWGGRQATR